MTPITSGGFLSLLMIVQSFICATGGNATVSMPIKSLGNFKVPGKLDAETAILKDLEIIVNTEWAMRGGSVPVQPYITRWDFILDKDLPIPGQQPFDYMSKTSFHVIRIEQLNSNVLSCGKISR